MKNSMEWKDVYLGGELARRAEMNLKRFCEPDFSPTGERAFRSEEYEWPGDNEGRLLLAHVLLEKCTHRFSPWRQEILDGILDRMNERGYYGPILPNGEISEQQAAGNSWILRGLLEAYLLTKENRILEAAKKLVHGYLYSLAGEVEHYPFGEAVLSYKGEAEGCLIPTPFGKWYMSTDYGCLFILVDGASKAYEILREERLAGFVEQLIERFTHIEIDKLHFQTHATLSCTRGILRYYQCTGKKRYLQLAEAYFRLYVEKGMDACYANYNWFGIPEFTEPCAIVDSFLLTLGLYRCTGNAVYLNLGHYIMYNGLMRGQRSNGGFGCDLCVGGERFLTEIVEENYEAWWCCSKRGAEFFAEISSGLFLVEDSCLYLPFYENAVCKVQLGTEEILLCEHTEFPEEGYVRLEILKGRVDKPAKICFFLPEYVAPQTAVLYCNGERKKYELDAEFLRTDWPEEENAVLELYFQQSAHLRKAHGLYSKREDVVFMHGPLILGTAVEKVAESDSVAVNISLEKMDKMMGAKYRDRETGAVFSPIKEGTFEERQRALNRRQQVVFKKGCEK